MNDINIIGRLIEAPRTAVTQNGTTVTTLRVAVSRRANRGKADYFTVVTWRALAESCESYLEKGQQVAVRGEMQSRSYEDEKGKRRWTWEITADEVEFLAKPLRAELKRSAPEYIGEPIEEELSDEDLPF